MPYSVRPRRQSVPCDPDGRNGAHPARRTRHPADRAAGSCYRCLRALAAEGHMAIARRKLVAAIGGAAAWPIEALAISSMLVAAPAFAQIKWTLPSAYPADNFHSQ